MPDQSVDHARDRARRLFEFIKRFDERRSPIRRDLDDAEWSLFLADLPRHPAVRVGAPGAESSSAESSSAALLSITQPSLTSCPEPPAAIHDWLLAGWKEPDRDPELLPTRALTPRAGAEDGTAVQATEPVETFASDASRVSAFNAWLEVRAAWAIAERPAREVAGLFQQVLGLWARLQREGDALRVYLGDALLVWLRKGDPGGPIRHPLVLLEVEVRFDEQRREIAFIETGRPPFLHAQLLSLFVELAGEKRRVCRDIVEASAATGGCHPLAAEPMDAVVGQLAAVLDVKGLAGPGEVVVQADLAPVLQRRALFLALPPLAGLQAACDAFLEGLQASAPLPPAVARIVHAEPVAVSHPGASNAVDAPRHDAQSPPTTLYFTKPANAAQEAIAGRLAERGAVLVQGPPGTGKTHTIANLIGHALAQGQRVLVTAQTTKALRVLREKVAEPLQPLCVGVLDSNLESRAELGQAVNGIVARLTSDVRQFDLRAATLRLERDRLDAAVAVTTAALRAALQGEYDDIVVGGEAVAPSRAARRLADGVGRDDWLPGPVTPGAPLPLASDEAAELYRLTADLDADDEALVLRGLPDPQALLSTDQFAGLVAALAQPVPASPVALWAPTETPGDLAALQEVHGLAVQAVATLDGLVGWQAAATQAGLLGGAHREPWDALVGFIETTAAEYPGLRVLAAEYTVVLGSVGDAAVAFETCEQIRAHIERGGSLSWFGLLGKGHWSALLQAVTVGGQRPATAAHFRALGATLRLAALRDQTLRRWSALVGAAGLPMPAEHATEPEEYAQARVREIRRVVAWADAEFAPTVRAAVHARIPWPRLLDATPALPPYAELRRAHNCLRDQLLPAVAAEIEARRRADAAAKLDAGLAALPAYPWLPAAQAALAALRGRSVEQYAAAVKRLWALWALRPAVERRRTLLDRVAREATTWADAVRTRALAHRGPSLPGPAREAWLYRQWAEELERRHRADVDELQRGLARTKEQLREVTAGLVENLAWAAQVRRTSPAQHRALMSWLDLVRRIGKGTGARAEELRRQAQRQLDAARDAVPVWIMPLSRVAESFRPGATEFDVVILDEASQCDLRAVLALALGRSVVVVGDDEQVSPMDVGQAGFEVRALQDEFLPDFPDRDLFDGRSSAYEIARRAFPGGLIRLVEHFRSVPDIIAFSNGLAYGGEIRPLREASSARVQPAVIAHRVRGGQRGDHQTNREEALEVVALVAAVCATPDYAGLSLGVVSLLGEVQAREIDLLLQRFLDVAEYKRRRLVCGIPAHFQGDERDVMFLSMVYSPQESGPLMLIERDDMKRRYNVAASRARDQMWIVHSLSADTDLKAGDLRRRLLEHAADPRQSLVAAQRAQTESDFERRVFDALVARGFRVRSQVEVGAYRLDLVVEGSDGRVVVECDGDRYHPLETLDRDLERQSILERLGWRFVRTRGSQFYRQPGGEMDRVVARLGDLGIQALGALPPGAATVVDSRVRDAVVAAATRLRSQWLADAGSLAELFEQVRPRGRRAAGGRGTKAST